MLWDESWMRGFRINPKSCVVKNSKTQSVRHAAQKFPEPSANLGSTLLEWRDGHSFSWTLFHLKITCGGEKEPRQGSPLSTWASGPREKDWPKGPSDRQLPEPWKKTLTGPQLPWWRQSVSLHTRHRQGPRKPSSCATFTLNSQGAELPQAGKKSCIYAHKVTSAVSNSLRLCRLWPTRLLCQGRGFSRQGNWSVLANTGILAKGYCHTLLEHYISCCPSCQLPWGPGAARAPVTQAAAPALHLVLTGANPSPPGQPQEQTPVTTHMQRWT